MINGANMAQGPSSAADDGSSAAMVTVPAAISIGLLCSFVQSLGLTIQRKSYLNSACPHAADPDRPQWKKPLWLVGFTIFIVANVGGTVFQIGALPIVMLAPLGAVSLLYNALLAKFLLDDVLGRMMIGGTALILAGAVLIGYFGAIQEPPHSLEQLLALFGRPPFIALATILFLSFFCVATIAHLAEWQLHAHINAALIEPPREVPRKSKRQQRRHSKVARRWSVPSLAPLDEVSETRSGVATPVLEVRDRERQPGFQGVPPPPAFKGGRSQQHQRIYGTMQERSRRAPTLQHRSPSPPAAKVEPNLESIARTKLILAVVFAAISGTLSGVCLLLAKSGVELLVLTFGEGRNQFDRIGSWALVVIMIFAALAQLWYLSQALRMADPTLVCPLAFCFYNTSSIAVGLVYFDQLDDISPGSLALVVFGVVVLLAGVLIVSMKPPQSSDAEANIEEATEAQAQSMVESSPTESTAIMAANGAGVAGPHLPPPAFSVTSAEDTAAADQTHNNSSPESQSDAASPPAKKTHHRRRSSGGTLAGLGLHLPDYNSRQRRLSDSDATQELPGGNAKSVALQQGRRHSTVAERRNSDALKQRALLRLNTRKANDSLYHSILNRGLSIGLSPSSPGFHVGSFSPCDEDEEEEAARAQQRSPREMARLRQQRGPRRVFSEADASGVDATRRRSQDSSASSENETSQSPEPVSNNSTLHAPPRPALERQSSAGTTSNLGVRFPALDSGALTERLYSLRDRRWLAGMRQWWVRNVYGREDWREQERRRLLEDA